MPKQNPCARSSRQRHRRHGPVRPDGTPIGDLNRIESLTSKLMRGALVKRAVQYNPRG